MLNKHQQGWEQNKPEIIKVLEHQGKVIDEVIDDLNRLAQTWIDFLNSDAPEAKIASKQAAEAMKQENSQVPNCESCGRPLTPENGSPEPHYEPLEDDGCATCDEKGICDALFGDGGIEFKFENGNLFVRKVK